MVPIDIEALIVRACNGYMESVDIGLNLDIADIVKQKPSIARKALDKILKIVSDEIDRQAAFLAVQLLDCLMVNCGFPFQLDHAMKRSLKLIKKWKLSLCDKSRYRQNFTNIILMHDLLVSKAFIFPPIGKEELDSMIGFELQTLRTKESLEDEEKAVLEAKLEYHLWKGGASDIKKANEIMKQMIESQDPLKYSSADSQILQDLQKLSDKLILLEDLIKNHQSNDSDSDTFQSLLDNPAIGQMYRTARDELPKLLELANSNLNEDLMVKIIEITERLTEIKGIAETKPKNSNENNKNKNNNNLVQLATSQEALNNIFDDIPQLSPTNETPQSTSMTSKSNFTTELVSYTANSELFVDFLKVSKSQFMLRLLNGSNCNELKNIRIKSLNNTVNSNNHNIKTISPLQTISLPITTNSEEIVINYHIAGEERELKINEHKHSDGLGLENLLLI